jgi:recombination protein RecR
MYPPNIENFIKIFSKLPGIGPKSSERIAFYLLYQPEEFVMKLSEAIKMIKKGTKRCSICGNIDVKDPCSFCSDPRRDDSKICVVETPLEIYFIESTNLYNGLYHCLGGVISPLQGITPEKLSIGKLLERVNSGKVRELIFALSATLEGDTTVLYIKELLKNKDVKITTLARGIPVGTGLQYAGINSILQAFKGREEVK